MIDPKQTDRQQIAIDIPVLTPFEMTVLRRLKSMYPTPHPYDELVDPRTPQNDAYINRLIGLGLVSSIRADDDRFFCVITNIGEQVADAIPS